MKVLLTGGAGNVGSHTLPELVARGHTVRWFERSTTAKRRSARGLPPGVEVVWGDITDAAAVLRATAGVDAVVHLAALIPPAADEEPERARAINVDGTANVVAACQAQPTPPRLLFSSTFDVHGYTLDKLPPRRVDDPLVATDPYTEHKIKCEELVRESGLTWCIFRFADVPILGVRDPHPIMFEIGLDNRIEALHAGDAGLAIANALETPGVWGRVLFVGGGSSCQLTYREYLTRLLAAMGVEPLPDEAFSTAVYATDWIDTTESEALLHYQRHDFADIAEAIAASLGWKRRLVPLVGPLARGAILRLSPYHRQSGAKP
ncbi:NAD-dependent epimerase/dehydratase family protein [Actinoplanes regularis]|uniref:Nucleoside-diphosphate-sugar epimerase n=1 Tax=Actinoplanes regularis TaxID=52697 RepID=A0A238YFJ3_9ACTN|nr:NAD(P)-dependent oxidoreductase [Actinoplanes regularis]GIE85922.1 3-beta hydroxysteroid dehydrogenase [Actinoplanes regularis]SNR70036.1 Nucleoside-diphosphate-sugar epimerase [Actinoplanes regularis]